MDFVLKRN